MKEQSHKDEMCAALRGDFARLRERGVAVTLGPREGGEPDDVLPDTLPTEPTESEAGPSRDDEPVERPGLFARLLGR